MLTLLALSTWYHREAVVQSLQDCALKALARREQHMRWRSPECKQDTHPSMRRGVERSPKFGTSSQPPGSSNIKCWLTHKCMPLVLSIIEASLRMQTADGWTVLGHRTIDAASGLVNNLQVERSRRVQRQTRLRQQHKVAIHRVAHSGPQEHKHGRRQVQPVSFHTGVKLISCQAAKWL